jgi:hypothetical protein
MLILEPSGEIVSAPDPGVTLDSLVAELAGGLATVRKLMAEGEPPEAALYLGMLLSDVLADYLGIVGRKDYADLLRWLGELLAQRPAACG